MWTTDIWIFCMLQNNTRKIIESKSSVRRPSRRAPQKDEWTLVLGKTHWLVSNFIPTDSKKFESKNFNKTIRFSIKNKLEIKKNEVTWPSDFREKTIFDEESDGSVEIFGFKLFRICRSKVWNQPNLEKWFYSILYFSN